MNYLNLINPVGPFLLAVMLIAALRREADFNLVKCLLTAFAALGADFLLTLATLGLKGPLGTAGAAWFYLLAVPVAVALLVRFLMRLSWQAAGLMAAFYIVASVGLKIAEASI